MIDELKNLGDINSAVESAGFYAKKFGKDVHIYANRQSNAIIWQVSHIESDYRDRINNSGSFMFRVTPTLEVHRIELDRK